MFDIMFSAEAARGVFTVATLLVSLVALRGYMYGHFHERRAFILLVTIVGYAVVFLSYRFLTGHVTEEYHDERYYALLASIHGTLSLVALLLTVVMFTRARRGFRAGVNFFKLHPVGTAALIVSWLGSLISGFFV